MKKKLLGFIFLLSVFNLRSQVVVANFTANPLVICPGQSVQFTDLSTGNPNTWNWSFPGGSPATSTLQNPVVTYNNPGSYNVVLSASNGGLPSVVTTFNYITVNSPPSSPGIISGPLTLCQGKLAVYSVSQVTNAITYSWTVPPTSTLMSGQGTNSITVLIGPGLSTLCVSAGNGCGYGPQSCTVVTGLFSPSITVSPSNGVICSGSSVTLTANGGLTYTWSPPSGLSGTSGSMVVATPTVSTIYTVAGTAATGCTNQATSNISVLPGPTVTVTPPSTVICTGGSVTLIASGATTYVWSPLAGLNTGTGATVVASPTTSTSYTVTGTSTTGCTAKAVVTISVATAPPGIPGAVVGTPLACAGLTGTYMITPPANASSYSWTVPPGATIVSGQGTNSIMVLFGGSSGSVCVSAGNGCGYGASSCLPVFPLAQPVIIVTPPSATICQGSSTTFIASGASSYSWSPGSGLNNTNSGSVIASPSASIIYTVTGTATTGCSNTKTVDVLVNAAPSVSINPKAPSICGNGSVSLTASGAASYSWSPGNGLNTTTGATVVASPTVTTTYTVTGSSTTGCTGSAAVTVTVSNLPPGAPGLPVGATTVVCSGDTASFFVSPVLNASSYSWTVPAGAIILSGQGSTLVVVQFGNSSGNICVSAANGCGSGPQGCKVVIVDQKPTVVVTPAAATICAGSFVTLSASGASTYSWSPATAINSTTLATIVAGPLNNITYSVTGTSTNGCSNTASTAVTVDQPPVIVISPSTPSICLSGTINLTASGAGTYTWSPPASLNTNTGSNVIASPTVNTTYTITGTATTGCVNQAMVTVTVSTNPPAAPGAISGLSMTCGSTNADYSISTVPAALSYSWSAPPGFIVLSGQGSTLVSMVNGTTTGNICVTAMNGCGNSTSSCLSVTISPNPVVIASSSGTGCAGGSVTLSASGAATYSWAPPLGLNTTSGPTVITTSANIYTVTGTSVEGCIASVSVAVIFLATPVAQNPGGSADVCSGSASTYTIDTEPATTYSWTLAPGLVLLSQSNSSVSITINSPGTICVAGQNACGTGPQSCKFISVRSSPIISVTSSGTINCSVNAVTVSANISPTNSSVLWQGPSGSFSTATFSTASAGDYTFSASDNQNSCVSKTILTVRSRTVAAKFTASVIPSECAETVSKNNGSIVVGLMDMNQRFVFQKGQMIAGSINYSTASLVPANGLITNTLSNPAEDELYTIRMIDEGACFSDTTVVLRSVACDNALFIPQVFTPEGDGKNDLFVISGMPSGTGNSLTVFNRWGNKVFYKSEYDNTWDGQANVAGANTGKKLPTGTYYYILEFGSGGLAPITGFVVIQY